MGRAGLNRGGGFARRSGRLWARAGLPVRTLIVVARRFSEHLDTDDREAFRQG